MTFLPYLKAYAALIGAVITGLLGTAAPDSTLFTVLTIAAAICTALVTFQVPNLDPKGEHQDESVQPETPEEVDLDDEVDPEDVDTSDFDLPTEEVHGGTGVSGNVGPYSGDLTHDRPEV